MKFFHREVDVWSSKFNWVDDNNVFVGFDAERDCCENFGYEYVKDGKVIRDSDEFAGFNFDTKHDPDAGLLYSGAQCEDYDCGGTASFRLVNEKTGEEMFLVLYNSHNGYYRHGFDMSIDGTVITSGCI